MLKLPIGYDNFRELIDRKLDFVDKTLWIRDVLESAEVQVMVITRPRRFGKTLNLSMLHHFLAPEVRGKTTQGLFDNLKIASLSEPVMQHQGKYPVIALTFKDIKETCFENAQEKLAIILSKLYSEHYNTVFQAHLRSDEQLTYQQILEKRASVSEIQFAVQNLCEYLYRAYNRKPWVLIDEYDTPIHAAYFHGYFDSMLDLLRGFFSATFKTNPFLNRGIITGILRVAKESLFSGVNNLEVYSLLSSQFGTYFGFTEEEVSALLRQAELDAHAEAVRDWYNGYLVGEHTVYNPWSIVHCIHNKGALKPYWVNTSDNALVKKLVVESDEIFKAELERLLAGESIQQKVNEHIVFGDLNTQQQPAWTLLLMAGYLKVMESNDTEDGIEATLALPNREVRGLYKQIILSWLTHNNDKLWHQQLLHHLLIGNIPAFEHDLQQLIVQTFSTHDMAHQPEVFYHGFMIGITASLYGNPQYVIQSNRESGYGRYDYLILSRSPAKPSILFEFKRITAQPEVAEREAHLTLRLEQAASQALAQIEQQHYIAEAQQQGAQEIYCIGLAFCGKQFKLQYRLLRCTAK